MSILRGSFFVKIKNMKEIFRGVKVVELSSVLAGPAVGMFFAELGAEVIKIENATTGGDVTRSWKLPSEPQFENPLAQAMILECGEERRVKTVAFTIMDY